MTKTMAISAFYSGTISKSMTNVITILIDVIAKFMIGGMSSYKYPFKMWSFVKIEASLFENDFLYSHIQCRKRMLM